MSATAAAEKKVRARTEEKARAERRIVELAAKVAAAENFDDPGDVGKVLDARADVKRAEQERDELTLRLEAAEAAYAEAVTEEKTRTEDERRARSRKELDSFAVSLTSDLVSLGKKLAAHEALANSLPGERFKYWPASYAETASRSICTAADMARPGGVAQVDLRLLIPTRP